MFNDIFTISTINTVKLMFCTYSTQNAILTAQIQDYP